MLALLLAYAALALTAGIAVLALGTLHALAKRSQRGGQRREDSGLHEPQSALPAAPRHGETHSNFTLNWIDL